MRCRYDLAGCRVLLVDDLITTGLTSSLAVEALRAAEAVAVFVAVLGWTASESGLLKRVRFDGGVR